MKEQKKADRMTNHKNLTVLSHPLLEHYFSVLRDKNTSCELFRQTMEKVSNFLFIEALKNIKVKEVEIETPLCKCRVKKLDDEVQIIAAPILRAGLPFEEMFLKYFPEASIVHIGMCRDKKTLKPVWYLDKTKESYKEDKNLLVYILDPMLATGNSGKSAIELFVKKGVLQENITFVSLIAAPEGVENIEKDFPNVRIVTAVMDKGLNDAGYILPGLGDAGDRIFNTFK